MTEAGRPSELAAPTEIKAVDLVSSWKTDLHEMEREWTEIAARQEKVLLADWREAMSEMRRRHNRLVSDGRWVSGPSDFLGIIGHARSEDTHSRMLAHDADGATGSVACELHREIVRQSR